jgi:hypothetical protein
MLESREYATIREIAEGLEDQRDRRQCMLRLTLLAPDIFEANLEWGGQPAALKLDSLMRERVPVEWSGQRQFLLSHCKDE